MEFTDVELTALAEMSHSEYGRWFEMACGNWATPVDEDEAKAWYAHSKMWWEVHLKLQAELEKREVAAV